MVTLDFETERIINGSDRSPKPVGVSIKWDDKPSDYYAWAHPTENNTVIEAVKGLLKMIWETKESILCHNAKFDLRVAEEWFGLKWPNDVHDTMIMAFLNDPREDNLSLKPLAAKYLDMPPEEQDAVREWVEAHVTGLNKTTNPWGAHICDAPGKLVGEYAIGDTDRTYALFNFFKGRIYDEKLVD